MKDETEERAVVTKAANIEDARRKRCRTQVLTLSDDTARKEV